MRLGRTKDTEKDIDFIRRKVYHGISSVSRSRVFNYQCAVGLKVPVLNFATAVGSALVDAVAA